MSADIVYDLLNLHGPGHTNYTCLKAADEIKQLRADLAAARALLQEARDFTPGAWITGGATSLRQRIDTALFKDFAETKRARDLAYMNGYEVAKEEYRELLHKAEDDLAAARALLSDTRITISVTKGNLGKYTEGRNVLEALVWRIDTFLAGEKK